MVDFVHQVYGNNVSGLVSEMTTQSYPGLEMSAPGVQVS